MGLGHFLKDVGGAAKNIGKGAGWAVQPGHWDDIGRGVEGAAEYVHKHPGKVWDTGFEVGRAIAKDQLKPQNLLLNAGLLAATALTGGAAGGALAARLGSAGLSAAKGAETALEAVKVAGTVAKTVEEAGGVVKAAETAAVVGRSANLAKGAGVAEKVLARGSLGKLAHPIETMMQPVRNWGAEKILAGATESGTASVSRSVAASAVRGTSGTALKEMSGMNAGVDAISHGSWTANQLRSKVSGAQSAGAATHAAAHPLQAATSAVEGNESAKTYADEAMSKPLGQGYHPSNPHLSEAETFSGGSPVRKKVDSSSASYGARGFKKLGDDTPLSSLTVGQYRKVSSPTTRPHAWEGPGREALGGIKSGYDWRKMDFHKVPDQPGNFANMVTNRMMAPKPKTSQFAGVSPLDASEETSQTFGMGKTSDMYSISAGQQPLGALNPGQPRELGPGPNVNFGPEAGRAPGEYSASPQGRMTGDITAGRFGSEGRPSRAGEFAAATAPSSFGETGKGQGFFNFDNPVLGAPSNKPRKTNFNYGSSVQGI